MNDQATATATASGARTTAGPPPIDLRPLFAPASIAVVGASARGGIARTVRDNLRVIGSATRCHFVNPRYDELDGQPCYPSIEALPERPDIVLVAVNPLRAAGIVADAAAAGVPAVIVPGGGVVEGGDAAARMQRDVREIALRSGIALLGPNCMGIVDLTTNSATYIGDVNPWLPRGGVMGIAQSGSVTDAFLHSGNRIGFSRVVGCGSEVVLDTCDFLAYAIDDPETDAVILFLEGFRRPERFLALADRALEIGKPIMVVKVGASHQAQAAAIAHSGSMAGEERATDAALAAAGVIRCGDLDELLETAELVAGCHRTGRRVGRGRTGVVTVSTGEASLIADHAPRTGVDLPDVPDSARAALLADLPTLGYIGNPLDPWGATDPATAYGVAFEAFAASGAYDVLALVHDFPYRSLPSEVETALTVTEPLLAATAARPGILPVIVSLTSGEPTAEVLDRARAAGGVPVLRGAIEAFTAIASVASWEAREEIRVAGEPPRPGWRALAADRTLSGHDPTAPPAASDGGDHAGTAMPELESLAWLAAAGLPIVPVERAATPDEAVASADAIGYPVVVKTDAVGLAHKSDVGAVRVGLRDGGQVRAAATELLNMKLPDGATHRGLLVAPHLEGTELIVGARRDPSFGPLVLVGVGGIFAEVLDDVAIRLAPVSADDAGAMLDQLRGRRLLGAHRGRPGIDRAAVVDVIVRIGLAICATPEVVEIDVNPLISAPGRTAAADGLVVTRP
ncbi:MAG TPA: acetate--CoA ligase family protein [Candidatus Bathyarchaeia archaeon]|nr:acetate--CoA ligase family protein [Candidatus Bathyarchaeia archaeon]